ncbi:MAG: trypsin-like peptidase domain-containing protein [Clostridia bacterium]|nr:trypsin-like peptidase domain-containing protein [Clostridia bacterium]
MKRTWGAVVSTLVAVFLIAAGINWLFPLVFNSERTYSETNCLTEQISSDMDVYDIAKLYRDGDSTVAVKVFAKQISSGTSYSSLGSGVCVASKGYQTSIMSGTIPLVASKGSYIITNHHVIDMAQDSAYTDVSMYVINEAEEKYPCKIIWANKNLDLAVLYCDSYNFNYITMKDIVVDCEEKDRFDYQQVFAIGCPLDEQDYLNRMTVGNIATNDVLSMFTAASIGGYTVMDNMYEDVVDIAVGITSGNSGGGVFDENGYLIGLTTLGTSESVTGGNQMNGMVSVYPIMSILDRLIENNEANGANTIYTLESLGIYGIDANEASVAGDVTVLKNGTTSYYLNGQYYSASIYSVNFAFDDEGYHILKNQSSKFNRLYSGNTIVSCQDASGKTWTISDRNDFIYFLLNVNEGDSLKVTLKGSLGTTSTYTITL